ncbi:MAG: hypothetical protein PUP92_00765 [Rhizonema sp. PD38]|nr:hypothetical protein [Rhizonema sp. PD38]
MNTASVMNRQGRQERQGKKKKIYRTYAREVGDLRSSNLASLARADASTGGTPATHCPRLGEPARMRRFPVVGDWC